MKRLFLCLFILMHCDGYAQDVQSVEFNQDFLGDSGQSSSVDISRFAYSNTMLPGVYLTDIYVNGRWVGKKDLLLRDIDESPHTAVVCFSRQLLEMSGVDFSKLSETVLAALHEDRQTVADSCLQLSHLVDGAQLDYDASTLRANISIPQVALQKKARGYINPQFWDEGVNAATVSYQFNAYKNRFKTMTNTTYYLGLTNGINLGPWHLRNQGVLTKSQTNVLKYQNISTYLKKDIVSLNSQLLIGDAFTSGLLFDSIGFRGVQLASDDRMLPDSMVGYAPLIRGVAKTNAKVTVYQKNLVVYETTVSPGGFEINDLYATGQQGDLVVVVTEANGEQFRFTVPYMSFSPLLRFGMTKHNIVAGRTRVAATGKQIPLLQMETGVGLNNYVSLYGGLLFAKRYSAGATSVAFATPIGAFALGWNRSLSQPEMGHKQQGNSFSIKYSHQLTETNTALSMAAYHYSGKHYVALQDMMQRGHSALVFDGDTASDIEKKYRQRQRLQLNLTQPLAEGKGTVFMSGTLQNYWGNKKYQVQYMGGYSNTLGPMTYQLTIQRQQSLLRHKMETQYAVSVSMPLGKTVRAPTVSMHHYHANSGYTSSVALNGSFDDNNTWSYGVSGSHGTWNENIAASTQYRSSYAVMGGSYGYGKHYSQQSVNLSGGVVVHPGGITLSQNLGESIGIVEAKGAVGAKVNSQGVAVNRLGYAVIPYLTPYRMNQVDIDPKGISLDVELSTTSQRVTPHAGAVVMLKYPTVTGRSVLISVTLSHGEPVPFGAEVYDQDGHYVGVAGQGGSIFIRGLQNDTGKLVVKWGLGSDQQCHFDYDLSEQKEKTDTVQELIQLDRVCFVGKEQMTAEVKIPKKVASSSPEKATLYHQVPLH